MKPINNLLPVSIDSKDVVVSHNDSIMPKIIGKIEIPDGYESKPTCGNCGFPIGKYDTKVWDEVYYPNGTWSKVDICESCYCMENDFEESISTIPPQDPQDSLVVAAYQIRPNGMSRLITGKENVDAFLSDNKNSPYSIFLFTDLSFAEKQYDIDLEEMLRNP